MAQEVPVTQARADFADLVNRVVYGGERIVMTRHGKPLVALVPAADLERIEQLERADADKQRDRDQAGNVVRISANPVSQPTQQPGTNRRRDIAAHDESGGATPRY